MVAVSNIKLSKKAKEHLLGMRNVAGLGPNKVWWLEGTPDDTWLTIREFGRNDRVLKNSSGVPIVGFGDAMHQGLQDRVIDLAEDEKGRHIVCRVSTS